jgi:hypothetical protein
VAWDPRVLDAARELMKKFPPLEEEFAVLEQLAGVNVTAVVERALGREQDIAARIDAAADRAAGESLLRDLKAERGRPKDERARLYLALGKKMLAIGDRKNGRIALREAAQLSSQKARPEIERILDDLPGAKGREWRAADATAAVSGKPSEPAMLRVRGKEPPPKAMLEERFLAAPLLSKITAPNDALSIDVTLEHDTERIRSSSVRPKETSTAPMVGMVARDAQGKVLGIVCGAFASPIERFGDVSIPAETTHVSIRAGATFAETTGAPSCAPAAAAGCAIPRSRPPTRRPTRACDSASPARDWCGWRSA